MKTVLVTRLPTALAAALATALASTAFALTCPTHLKHDKLGFWVSEDTPGWESQQSTQRDDLIVPASFEVAVVSPQYKRIACVYRSSKGRQVPLVSRDHLQIHINRHSRNDKRGWAWHWNKRPKDFTCGLPDSTHLNECQFELKHAPSSPHNVKSPH